eukprot:gnl/TRDRNA2_/TRDRNA2_142344_c1_seq4.p1 gnl/TRDRNA2_/TRDRNA2_142344_c1~~gnl/TRDRNA2_/TRDRNA2_142344_c1_seq4.p1  ORF type:complete len:214 (+),score=21.43 gnl/TRDRNA2_/TRDRNA2_142344_c1_seq4:60-701(+)
MVRACIASLLLIEASASRVEQTSQLLHDADLKAAMVSHHSRQSLNRSSTTWCPSFSAGSQLPMFTWEPTMSEIQLGSDFCRIVTGGADTVSLAWYDTSDPKERKHTWALVPLKGLEKSGAVCQDSTVLSSVRKSFLESLKVTVHTAMRADLNDTKISEWGTAAERGINVQTAMEWLMSVGLQHNVPMTIKTYRSRSSVERSQLSGQRRSELRR